MSSVPYIFADDYGNIPLSYLDANFANVKANVDYATAAGAASTALAATTAGTVTTNAQPNITTVGTLSSVTVSGNATVGNISTGNISVGSITSTGNVTIAGTLTAGNIKYTSNVFVGDLKGSVYADDSTIMVDAIDNSISANSASFDTITATGSLTANGNTSVGNITASNRVTNSGLEIVGVNVIGVFSNATTSNLSASTTLNFIFGGGAYTHTVNMPTNPVNGQLTKFTIVGNALTLVEGTGTLNVGFAGPAAVGNSYVYLYRTSGNLWVKTA